MSSNQEKIINLQSEITLYEMLSIQTKILYELQNPNTKIVFQIASQGGDIAAAISLYYWLQSLETDKLEIRAFYHLASAANVLLLTKHLTTSYPHCDFMFHPCNIKLEFNSHSEQAVIASSSRRVADYWKIFSDRTNGKIDFNWIKENEHIYLYPNDLVDLKIIDRIL